jgi:hypothetical protein
LTGVSSGVQEPWGINSWGGGTDEEWGGSAVTEVGILTIASPVGIELDIAEGIVDPSPDATVVGIGLSASIAVGSVIEADANVSHNRFRIRNSSRSSRIRCSYFCSSYWTRIRNCFK